MHDRDHATSDVRSELSEVRTALEDLSEQFRSMMTLITSEGQGLRSIERAIQVLVPRGEVVLVLGNVEAAAQVPGRLVWPLASSADDGTVVLDDIEDGFAVRHLQAAVKAGASYLLIQATYDRITVTHPRLSNYLDVHWALVHSLANWRMYHVNRAVATSAAALQYAVGRCRAEGDQNVSLLQWGTTAISHEDVDDAHAVTMPLSHGLPYLDSTFSLVAVSSNHPECLPEAERVASAAVLVVGEGDGAVSAKYLRVAPKPLPVIVCFTGMERLTSGHTKSAIEKELRCGRAHVLVHDSPSETLDLAAWQEAVASLGAHDAVLICVDQAVLPLGTSLSALADTASETAVGVVGGLVLSPDGRLVSAGSLLLDDGSLWETSYGEPLPDAPTMQIRRGVSLVPHVMWATRLSLLLRYAELPNRNGDDYSAAQGALCAMACTGAVRQGHAVIVDPEAVAVDYACDSRSSTAMSLASEFASCLDGSAVTRPPSTDLSAWRRLAGGLEAL